MEFWGGECDFVISSVRLGLYWDRSVFNTHIFVILEANASGGRSVISSWLFGGMRVEEINGWS